MYFRHQLSTDYISFAKVSIFCDFKEEFAQKDSDNTHRALL